jgi:hypothetical protein
MFVRPALIDPVKHSTMHADLDKAARGKATLQIRDPETNRLLPPEGAEVPENGFWMRRLRDGDVVADKPPPKAA